MNGLIAPARMEEPPVRHDAVHVELDDLPNPLQREQAP
jgi:hypothetical protein